ncbi:MAG: LysR family transcriptional regulator [Gammaproteobacteria bacterium]|nr:LysR family transcriptional regulator [Gammaproteobacteria bacterium]
MELRQLRHFLAVMDAGNFAAAAQNLGLTSQAIGRSIQKLESEFGLQLFTRQQRSVTPNEFAHALESHARRMVMQQRAALEEISAMDLGSVGEVRIALGGAMAGEVGPRAICRFQQKYPRIRISLTGGLTDALIRQLRRGDIDLVAGVATPDWRLDAELEVEKLFPTETVILARRGHPLAGRADLTLAELARYPWIVSSRHIGDTGPLPLLDVFHSAGINPPTQLLYSDAVSAAMGLLVRGDFLTLSVTYAVPLTVVSRGDPNTPFVWLNHTWPAAPNVACLVYRAGVELARPARLLAAEIRQVAAELHESGFPP